MLGQWAKWPLRIVDVTTFALFGGLILANVAAWAWALAVFASRPAVMATALLAWAFGLRHAADADHIAAIDNAVRKLMHAGHAPKSVGLYFAIGHSTVVVITTMLFGLGAIRFGSDSLPWIIGGLIGTSVSSIFLLLIAVFNLGVFVSLWRAVRSARDRGAVDVEKLDALLASRGVVLRWFAPLFRMITKSWHVYPIGLLFGLGFDTATEVSLLSMSAAEVARGMSLSHMLVFPALFTAAMALIDTADSTLMVGAYRWAFINPSRKLWYNLTMTGASVAIALFIGSVEALGLIGDRFGLSSGLWTPVENLNVSLASFGFVVIGLFSVVWLVSIVSYRATLESSRLYSGGRTGPDGRENVDAVKTG